MHTHNPVHSNRVTALRYVADTEWILSVSRDKSLQWCCTKTGRKLGGFEAQAWCQDVAYDTSSKYVFVADYSGQINVLRLDTQGFQFITTLKGHQSEFALFINLFHTCTCTMSCTLHVSLSLHQN